MIIINDIMINGEMYISLNIFLELNNDFIDHTITKNINVYLRQYRYTYKTVIKNCIILFHKLIPIFLLFSTV